MADYPLIGILVTSRKNRKGILQLYQRYHNLPLKLFAFIPADIFWQKLQIAGLCQVGGKWKESIFPFPDAVYNRCYIKNTTTIQLLEHIIGQGKCFNRMNWFNKWEVYTLLKQSNLNRYIPDTFLFDQADLPELLQNNKLVFIKPSYGNQGKNVYRLELKENKDIHISLHSLAPRYICRKHEDIQQKLNTLSAKKVI